MTRNRQILLAMVCLILSLHGAVGRAQLRMPYVPREQRQIRYRDPSQLRQVPIPDIPSPRLVSQELQLPRQPITLDDAIRRALANTQVVRVLTGISAAPSGRTIFDPAIANSGIDEQNARFDPILEAINSFDRNETLTASPDPLDPSRTVIDNGIRTDRHSLDFGVSKQTITGGTAAFGVTSNRRRFQPGTFPLNPETRPSADISMTQPLLQGRGVAVNQVPIVLARIDTERSFFQLKDALQETVRGVIQGYWNLVAARVNLWAREQQVEQTEFAFDRASAERKVGRIDAAQVAQTEVAVESFRSSVIAAKAEVLNREAALRNIMGIAPEDGFELVPTTVPHRDRTTFDWHGLAVLAEQNRPDIIELKLILEADEQLLLQARNQALPRVDASALYRWNGLEGEMPVGDYLRSDADAFTDWQLGVNFSVPLGLRQSRAALRRQRLIIRRDATNLNEGLRQAVYRLALNARNVDQLHEQYLALQRTRIASRRNLEAQLLRWREGFTDFLNPLQAITSWGDSVSLEAQSLTQYNASLADLERETGTILESHGVAFFEERFDAISPLGRLGKSILYPAALRPSENSDRYLESGKPLEDVYEESKPDYQTSSPIPNRSRTELPLPAR